MNKVELIAAMAARSGLSKKETGAALAALVDGISDALKAGERVVIPNLGTFEVRERAAREGRNPRTGETVKISAKKLPAFKAGKALKEAVK